MPEVIMPKMGDAMTEGTLLQWKRKDGETVKPGDVIAEIETDKSNVEVEAEDSGVLHLHAKAGDTVPVGTVIAVIGDDVFQSASTPNAPAAKANVEEPLISQPRGSNGAPAAPPAQAPGPAASQRGNGRERLKASPLARNIAREHGVDIARVTGTGPNGRVIEADVVSFAQSAPSRAAQPSAANQSASPAVSVTPVELSPIRKVIAKRMVQSKTTIPHFYVTSEIDMADATILRDKLNSYDETLPKISFNDLVVKATAKALVKVPAANAAFQGDKIHPGNGVHIGIAVALDDGLIVPVVRDADRLSLRRIAATSKGLITKARDKKLQPAEYSGGTFTVTNLGPFDVENFIAIIDPSQGAILAVSSILKKAVVLEDGVTIAARPRMNVTFSGDHRVMDGATGAKFLQEFKRVLQNPLALLDD